jgi:hypothetical protein
MPSISYDTAFEVALSAGLILYYILVHACIAAETLRGHLSKVIALGNGGVGWPLFTILNLLCVGRVAQSV